MIVVLLSSAVKTNRVRLALRIQKRVQLVRVDLKKGSNLSSPL